MDNDGKLYDQGTDATKLVCALQIEMFVHEHRDQQVISTKEVQNFLLDLYLELTQ